MSSPQAPPPSRAMSTGLAEHPTHGHGDGPTGDRARPSTPRSTAPAETQAPSNRRRFRTGLRSSSRHDAADQQHDDRDASSLPMSKARSIALVATVTGAAFLNTVSIQSVVIVLPAIGSELAVPETRQQWIVSSYSLTFGCFLLFWGRVADIYGKRLVFILGSIWVTGVTVANAFMPNEITFDLFRGLHGLGAAANVPTAIGILGVTFPPGKAKNYAFSTYAAGAPLGNVFGNVFSGLIAQYFNWKWVFGASAIIAGIISIAGIIFIPSTAALGHIARATAANESMLMPPDSATATDSDKADAQDVVPTRTNADDSSSPERGPLPPLPPPSIDWIGACLITCGLLALLFALTEGNVAGWRTPWVPITIVASLVVIVCFALWQRRLERLERLGGLRRARHALFSPPPLVKVSIFANARFSAVMVIMALFFASFSSFLVYATFYFQDYQGLSPLDTMLRFIPAGGTGIIIVFIVAQLLSRVPTLFILICGSLSVSLASLLFALPLPTSTSYFAYGLPAMMLAVVGADTTWPSLTLFTSQALPRVDQAVGGALINAVGQFGRSIGLAVDTAVQTAVMANDRGLPIQDAGGIIPGDPASLRGLRIASWLNFGYGLACLAIILVSFRTLEVVGKAPPAAPAMAGVGQADAGQDKRPPADAGTMV